MAVRDIAGQSLAATLSSLTISSATISNGDAFPCQSGTVCCLCAVAVDEVSGNSDINKTTAKNQEVVDSKNSDASDDASSSKSDVTSTASLSLPSTTDKDSEAVSSVLCLLHGLSHCSYHEPSLLVLVEHSAYDAAVDLFACLWHRLQTSQQPDDKTQVYFLFHVQSLKYHKH